jgi:uncharacterized protein
MAVYTYPGVYVEELPATGPIQGVGTSTVAFIGPTVAGPMREATKITNWSQFVDRFGAYFPQQPRLFMAYAVRGFFENGGSEAYIVRVGTAVQAYRDLPARGAGNSLRVRAKEFGTGGNLIKVDVASVQAVPAGQNAKIHKARAEITTAVDDVVTLKTAADMSLFRVGDVVGLEGTAEQASVREVRPGQLVLDALLTTAYTSTAAAQLYVFIRDLPVGAKRFRVENGAGIQPGSVLAVSDGTAANDEDVTVASVSGDVVMLDTGLTKQRKLGQTDPNVTLTSYEFKLTVSKTGAPLEPPYDLLSLDPRHSRYYKRIVTSNLVDVMPSPNAPTTSTPPSNLPAPLLAAFLQFGAADNPTTLTASDFQLGLDALRPVDDVNLIAVPDLTTPSFQMKIVEHCEDLGDRFAILDTPNNLQPLGPGSALAHRQSLSSERGFGALYYPWIWITDPLSPLGDGKLVPPSGHVAGVFARSDAEGVHHAPANQPIVAAYDAENSFDLATVGALNVEGVNVIRMFSGSARPLVWGARTLTRKDELPWRYVNVRRLFSYVEESIAVGIRWAVFAPNDLGLWKRLERTIGEFLGRVWRSGALFGATAKEAYFVRADEELNPESVRAMGEVIVEIGLAPVRPAEFVIVRVAMRTGGADVTETGKPVDAYRNFNFLVEIDGIAQASFADCSGLGATTEVIEAREGSENTTVRKLPGKTTYSDITLKWGTTSSDELWRWRQRVIEGEVDRKNGSIVVFDLRNREEVVRWNFVRAWPSRWDGPTLNAKGNDLAIETLAITHEGIARAVR